jgi:hypothetical protein
LSSGRPDASADEKRHDGKERERPIIRRARNRIAACQILPGSLYMNRPVPAGSASAFIDEKIKELSCKPIEEAWR